MAGFHSVGQALTVEEIAAAGEVLVNEGKKDITEIVAALVAINPTKAAYALSGYSPSFAAQCLAGMSPADAASLLNEAVLEPVVAYDILADPNLSADEVQAILQSSQLGHGRFVEIITAKAMDVIYYSSGSVTGLLLRRDVTINSEQTLTVNGQPAGFVARKININGKGAGGLILVCKEFKCPGVVSANGKAGNRASGGNGGTGSYWLIGSDVPGKGGNGNAYPTYGDPGQGKRTGGGGGKASSSASPGDGGSHNAQNFNSSTALVTQLRKAIIDWWLINAIGKIPTSTTSLPSLYGSGGGAGSSYSWGQYSRACGEGGGGGGQVLIICTSCDFTGRIEAKGGKGGSSQGDQYGSGGGGGGGGIVYILYEESVNNSGSFDVSGGAGGSGGSKGGNGYPGEAGVAKVLAF